MDNLVEVVKNKREFRELPDSVVERVLAQVKSEDEDEKVKEARVILRKYFGVFMTNKVIKPKNLMDYDSVLRSHKSSTKRDYSSFYHKIFETLNGEVFGSIVDLGSGLNGFSYPYLRGVFGDIEYKGVEASGQLVNNTNTFFDKSGFGEFCDCIWGDLLDLDFVSSVLSTCVERRLVLLFQVVDALENLECDFSKKFLLNLKNNSEFIVVSLPVESLSGKKKFQVRRRWIVDFLHENFDVVGDFEAYGERFLCLKC